MLIMYGVYDSSEGHEEKYADRFERKYQWWEI